MIWVTTGTRPEIIKQAPIMWELDQRGEEYLWLHTGQHYDANMCGNVATDLLEDKEPDMLLAVDPEAKLSMGERLSGIKSALLLTVHEVGMPEVVIVQGDTMSALAVGLFCEAYDCNLAHVEAGLRSDDLTMPEETARVILDQIALWKFPPTQEAQDRLRQECRDAKSFIVGNTFVEAVMRLEPTLIHNVALNYGVVDGEYYLLTLHRPENVDNRYRLTKIIECMSNIAKTGQVLFPAHPRTLARLAEWGIQTHRIQLMPPQPPIDFLSLEQHAKVIVTDSGGVQEEAFYFGVPCITVRQTTERPETILAGANRLVNIDAVSPREFSQTVVAAAASPTIKDHPYGSNGVAKAIIDAIMSDVVLMREACREMKPQQKEKE
jgi:UDP-N-acetylglucosamine 2-epimerase (non-hydrolysing)